MWLQCNIFKELKYNLNLEEKLPENSKNFSEVLASLLLSVLQSKKIAILLEALTSYHRQKSYIFQAGSNLSANVHLEPPIINYQTD